MNRAPTGSGAMNGAPTSPAPVRPSSRGGVHYAHAVAGSGPSGRRHGTRGLSAKAEHRPRVRAPQAYLNAYGVSPQTAGLSQQPHRQPFRAYDTRNGVSPRGPPQFRDRLLLAFRRLRYLRQPQRVQVVQHQGHEAGALGEALAEVADCSLVHEAAGGPE